MEKKNIVHRKTSIKTTLMFIPLLVVFLSIASMTIISSLFVRSSLLSQMKTDGLVLGQHVAEQIESNTLSLRTINTMLEDKIRVAANTIIANENTLSNELIKQIGKQSDVTDIYWYSNDGTILYSTVDEYIGWKPSADHPVETYRISGKNELMEEIRKDSESDNYFKYGYLRAPSGSFVQVGISANEVENLTQRFSYQTLCKNLVSNKNIVYATIVDKNLKTIADSDEKDIGKVYKSSEEEEMVKAMNGTSSALEWHNKQSNTRLLEVTIPITFDGKVENALIIGISMETVFSAIKTNILIIAITGLIAIILLALTLIKSSNYVIKIINKLKKFLSQITSGDLTMDLSQEDLNRTNELGEIANAVQIMKNSIKDMIKNIANTSVYIASSSVQLSTSSEQVAAASNSIAITMGEIAEGATTQSKETEEGYHNINLLSEYIGANQQHMISLNDALEQVKTLKNEGTSTLDILVEKTSKSKSALEDIQNVITDTNKSAEKIDKASQMIKSIASQTNLLALNAAIEAARAGESGKGFAVVADEIRKLAEQSNNFTEEISKIIDELASKTTAAVNTMEEVNEIVLQQTDSVEHTNNKFDGISNSIDNIVDVLATLNKTAKEMDNEKNHILSMIESLLSISEENAAATEEVAATVEEQTASMEEISNASNALTKLAEEMQMSITKFKY